MMRISRAQGVGDFLRPGSDRKFQLGPERNQKSLHPGTG
jgi:hypothetical protein